MMPMSYIVGCSGPSAVSTAPTRKTDIAAINAASPPHSRHDCTAGAFHATRSDTTRASGPLRRKRQP